MITSKKRKNKRKWSTRKTLMMDKSSNNKRRNRNHNPQILIKTKKVAKHRKLKMEIKKKIVHNLIKWQILLQIK